MKKLKPAAINLLMCSISKSNMHIWLISPGSVRSSCHSVINVFLLHAQSVLNYGTSISLYNN